MKKILKIICINIFLVIFILMSAELILRFKNDFNIVNLPYCPVEEFRKPSIPQGNINKLPPPIILMGGSFTYGAGLQDKETFSAVLSRYTGRIVYNFALCGASPREALYILKEDKELLETLLTPEPNKDVQYVIYTYIPNHLTRLYCWLCRCPSPNFKFDKKKKEFVYHQAGFLEKIYNLSKLYNTHKDHFYVHYIEENQDKQKEAFKLFILYIKELEKEIHKQFGENTKLVFCVYDKREEDFDLLKNEGITVIKLHDIVDVNLDDKKEFRQEDWHPSAKAWEVIVPALAKELNL